MKEYFRLILLIIICFVISGCGKDNTKKLECTFFNEENNMNVYGNLLYYFKNDKITNGEFKFSFKDIPFEISDNLWDSIVKSFYENNPEVDEIGYKKHSSVDNEKHEFYVTVEIDFEKISKDTIEKYDIDDPKGKSIEQIKKDFMAYNPNSKLTCK